jgi:chromatin assembly factor 1 subunit A
LKTDTSFPINPFTFVSTTVEDRKPLPGVTSEKGFAVPALPNRVIKKSDAANCSPTVVSTALKKFSVPKTAFPEEHLPVLLSKINTAQAVNLTVLVEAVSQELREHKVKKNAIEAKIREVGEKCKVRKFWVVKENKPVSTC